MCMKRNCLLLVMLSLLIINVKGQVVQFQKYFQTSGATFGTCIQQINICQGNIIPGYIIVSDNYTLIRTDIEGNIMWNYHYNYPHGGFSDYVQETSDCGFLISGSVLDSLGHKNYNLVKTDNNGNLLWTKQYAPQGNDSLYNAIYNIIYPPYYGKIGVKARQTDDNGYIVLGQINNPTTNLTYFQLIKTNDSGQVQWTKYLDSNIFKNNYYNSYGTCSHVYDMDLAGSGISKGFILLEQVIDTSIGNTYIVLVRTDSSGSVLWSKKYLDSYCQSIGFSIKETNDKGFIITGWGCGGDPLALKTDSNGVVQWKYNYQCFQPPFDYVLLGNSIKQTYDGGYIIGCCKTESMVVFEANLIKIDSLGNFQWDMGYQVPSASDAFNVIQCLDSGYAFVGSNDRIFFVKTNINGYSGCFDSLIPFHQITYTLDVTAIGDGLDVSVSNPLINEITQTPTVTVTTVCLTVNINEVNNNEEVKVYPNPSTISINVTLTTIPPKDDSLIITDILGTTVYHQTLNNRNTNINVSGLSNGVYFYQLINNKETLRGKFVKE